MEEYQLLQILKVCAERKDLFKGARLHADMKNAPRFGRSPYVANSFINMYAKCGVLEKAREVFHELFTQNVSSWNAFITANAQLGRSREALMVYERMHMEVITSDPVTFACVLKACGSIGASARGKILHCQIIHNSLLEKDVVLGNVLLNMYARCGLLSNAQKVLGNLPTRDVVSWNALITGYASNGQVEQALGCFQQMQRDKISPDAITFTSVLKACGIARAVEKGKQVHDEIVRTGFLEKDIMLGNALVDMYARCGMLEKSCQTLSEMPVRNIVSWTALIAGYVQDGNCDEALNCLEKARNEGFCPSPTTFTCILKACGCLGTLEKGRTIHYEIIMRGLIENNVVLGSALVDMYAKCGVLAQARQVLAELPARNVVSWSSLILGYAQQGQGYEALDCFECMQREGLSPDAITYACILKACGCVGAIDKGKKIHEEVVRKDLLLKNIVLGTALVDMYAKCGVLEKARELLHHLPLRNVVSWSALIAGYAQNGQGLEAMKCFEEMQTEGLSPNNITVLCLINACSHSGLVNEAETYFGNMSRKYGVVPTLEHLTCMVDILGSAGHFDKAISMTNKTACADYPEVSLAMLNACRKLGNLKLGRGAFNHALSFHGCTIRSSA